MGNVIPLRIAEFLRAHPPFHEMDEPELLALARSVEVRYLQREEELFRAGEQPSTHIYVVREGAINLLEGIDEGPQLVDRCDVGDLLGLRTLLAGDHYMLSAQAAEDSLLYLIPIGLIREVAERVPGVGLFLAAQFAAQGPRRMGRVDMRPKAMGSASGMPELHAIQLVDYVKSPVCCPPELSIREAATLMTDHNIGSVVVVDDGSRPVGMVTDKDFRRRIATGELSIDRPAADLMSSPVITLRPGLSAAEAQMAMLQHSIHHLCITEDGTDQSPLLGILSEHDLLLSLGNNPAILIREIRRCKDTAALARIRQRSEELLASYLQQEVSIHFVCTVMTAINDALTRRVIDLAGKEMDGQLPDVPCCWLALGSQGRGEQLLRTDQDNAFAFLAENESETAELREAFLPYCRRVNEMLHEIGFDFCPADMMAGNSQWCLSTREWKSLFSKWILQPVPEAVMKTTIFFDFRSVWGDQSLAAELTGHIFEQLDQEERFLSYLARDALRNPPPLTFFRNFVVEKTGAHEDQFDIKLRAMLPLADAARVLTLYHRLAGVENTFRRFEALAPLEPNYRELMEHGAEAYELLLRYRAWQGLQQGDDGRFFDPASLSKMERLNLRNAFKPVRELQSLLSTRFQLAFLS